MNNIIYCIIAAVVGYCCFKLNNIIFNKLSKKNEIYLKFIKNVLNVVIVMVTIYTILSQFKQFDKLLTTILAGSGVIAVLLSIAAQESIGNFISGFFISVCKPFNIGDRVTILDKNITGIIEDITLRHTVIKTYTNNRVIIPNSIMNKSIIENSNYFDDKSLAFIDVNIDYKSDVKKSYADNGENNRKPSKIYRYENN